MFRITFLLLLVAVSVPSMGRTVKVDFPIAFACDAKRTLVWMDIRGRIGRSSLDGVVTNLETPASAAGRNMKYPNRRAKLSLDARFALVDFPFGAGIRKIALLNTSTGKQVWAAPEIDYAPRRTVQFSPNGKMAAIFGSIRKVPTLFVYDTTRGKQVLEEELPEADYFYSISDDGKRAVVSTPDPKLYVFSEMDRKISNLDEVPADANSPAPCGNTGKAFRQDDMFTFTEIDLP